MATPDDVWSGHADREGFVSKSTLFDRLNQELEAFGKKAQAALDEGKLQIEVLRLKRQRDHAARDLGLLVYRRERGGAVEARRVDALMLRLDDLGPEIERLERQIGEARNQQSAADASPPAPATPAAGPDGAAPV
jgi:hypothetical protein